MHPEERGKTRERQGLVERFFETVLFQSRLVVVLAVVGSLLAAVVMFADGLISIAKASWRFVQHPVAGHSDVGHEDVSIVFIAAVDSFLFATVLLIFAMGTYELFISEIDPASRTAESRPNWLDIHSLDDLKGAVGKVILMILIVRLFESAVALHYERPLDLLFLGAAIALVSLALYLVHAGHHPKGHDKAASKADGHGPRSSVLPGSGRSVPPPGDH
jgi:uncharacterized membrane protein YqhA